MDNEKKERLKALRENMKSYGYIDGIEELDAIFPELAESEDEKIRKEIVEFIQWAVDRGSVPDKQFQAKRPGEWLAYLEKQKFHTEGDFGRGYDCGYRACLNSHGAEWFEKQKAVDEIGKSVRKKWAIDFIRFLDEHSYEGKMCVSNGECLDIENAFISADWEKLIRYYNKYTQKPAEWTGYSGIVIDKTRHPELSNAEWAIVRGFARIAGHSHFPITIIKETAQDFLAHLPAEWSEEDEKNWEQVLAYIPDDAIKGWMEKQKARIIAGIKPDQTAEYEKIKNTIAKCLACGKRDGVINDEENILCLDWIEQQGAPWFGEDAATRPDKEEHQCDCQHVGCHINNCRRWCQKFNNEVPYEFCGPTCSGYSHKNTEGISVKKPTWTGNDSMAIVSLEAIINNSNHDEARKKELLDWLLTRAQNGFSQTPEEKEFVRTIRSLVADFIYQKESVDTSYYQRLVDWVEKRHIESIEPLWTPTEAQMWALQEAVTCSCSSEYGGPLSEMLEMLNRALGRKTAWEKCKPGATDDNAVAFVYPSPEAWKFANEGTKFSEDMLVVGADREPRISRCAVNKCYYLPTSKILPPKSVTDKLVAQYGESHGEPALDK